MIQKMEGENEKMDLVYITLDYPYNTGETFCEDELRIARTYFDNIYILSFTGHANTEMRYTPDNSVVVLMRKRRYEKKILLYSGLKFFSLQTVREMLFAKRTLKVKEDLRIICKEIFIYYYYSCLLKRTLKQIQYSRDTIFYSYWLSEGAFALANNAPNAMMISRTHRYDCFIDRGYQPFRREILNKMDLIVSISEAGQNDIRKKLLKYSHAGSEKIVVSRLGILSNQKKPNNIGDSSRKPFVIVSCSNINRIKRIDLIIDALNILDIPVYWTHFGSGEEEEKIKRYSRRLEKKDNIEYCFAGAKRKQEIFEYYSRNRIDVFINSSDSEGIPVSIMEAMSYGIPVIARNVGGNCEILNPQNGILLAENITSEELANAIMEIYSLAAPEYERMRENAFNTYMEKYNAEKNYRQFFSRIVRMKSQ